MYHKIKKNAKNWIIPILCLSVVIFLYRNFFLPLPMSSGDWLYLYPEAIKQSVPLFSWDPYLNGGMGNSVLDRLWLDVYARFVLEAANIIPWHFFEKLFWFIPYISLTFLSAFMLAKKVGIASPWISGLIYSTNSYILLAISGGQLGIMAAYSILPFVVLQLLNLIETQSLKRLLLFSLPLAFLIMLDLRVGYIFLVIQAVVSMVILFLSKNLFLKLLPFFLSSIVIVLLIHSYWIFPIIFTGNNPVDNLSDAHTSIDAVNFFSFAKFENAISLLHPYWPENIFGKTEFLRPEFLLVPILALMGLIGIKRENKKKRSTLLTFALLAIIGVFLAKGSNEPFGIVYQFIFQLFPGFVMFRDPSKWYILVALSYSILIPYSLYNISQKINFKKLQITFTVVALIFLGVWCFLIRESLFGNVKGTFASAGIPIEYQKLYEYIKNDKSFYRTFWIPGAPTYGYTSINNPAIHANYFYNIFSPIEIAEKLNSAEAENLLRESSVRYVIIPEDSDGKLFLTDREYDESVYLETLEKLEEIGFLNEVKRFGKIVVFELENPKDHFWSSSQTLRIDYKYINPTEYKVDLEDVEVGNILVFAEKFDKNWVAINDELFIESTKTNSNLNSFTLPKSGSYDLTIFYNPQKYVNIGLIISLSVLTIIIGLLVYFKFKK